MAAAAKRKNIFPGLGEDAGSREHKIADRALTPQHALHLVCIHGREVLVATHLQGCSVITTVAERATGAQA
jgi:hypothetical protein